MGHRRAVKARQLLAALLRIGWTVAWQIGSHRRLTTDATDLIIDVNGYFR
ncbi:MAG: hypothetical protein JNK87_38485 [Bryobacterales bacterium]|nr:hypothetical protein [Bryobacterales bacterium]